MVYWIKSNGVVYEGDCQLGDTAATPEQVAAWQAAQALIPPPTVTRRQFFQAAAEFNLLTQAEVLARGSISVEERRRRANWYQRRS